MSDLHKKALLSNPALRLPPKLPASLSAHAHSPESKTAGRRKDYTPLPWTNYYDKMRDVQVGEQNSFRVYMKGDSGPVFFFLHGGGFSALSWSVLSSILSQKVKCQCIGLDMRGHGDTHTNDDHDLSIDTMANDVKSVIEALWPAGSPPIVLVGHSMGGAVAVHAAHLSYVKNLIALVVIDVVEGSALEALTSMQSFLQGRPKLFSSLEQAIEYSVRSGSIKNVESARVSIQGQLKNVEHINEAVDSKMLENIQNQSHSVMQTEIAEEDESADAVARTAQTTSQSPAQSELFKRPDENLNEKHEWRIDLTKTEKYWRDWFKGLSSKFLHVHVPKLLLLAGVDRLDKELMVGQMQGKFQMQVLPLCGHAVHEDSPEDVADALANFMLRHKFTEALDQIKAPRLSC